MNVIKTIMGMCDLYIGVTGSLNEIPKCHKDKGLVTTRPHFLSTAGIIVSSFLIIHTSSL